MGWMVPNFGEGGSVGVGGGWGFCFFSGFWFWSIFGCFFSGFWFWSIFGTGFIHLFCLSRPILPPEIFESGKNIGLDPLSLVKYGVGDVFFTAGSCELPILAS